MSLYTHFANKEELLDLMRSEISRRIYEDEHNPTWQAELLALSKRMHHTLGEHPRWLDLLARVTPPTPVATRDRILRLMIEDGLPADVAFQGFTAVLSSSLGLVLANASVGSLKGKASLGARFSRVMSVLEKTPAIDEAATRLALSKADELDFEGQLDFTMRTLIAGLEMRVESHSR